MKQEITELIFLVDRSKSMFGAEHMVLDTVNSLISQYRSGKQTCFVSVCLFSDQLEVIYMHQEDQFIKELSRKDYFVEGNTALYDAIGDLFSYVENSLSYLKDEIRKEIHIYIITDGTDNASILTSYDEFRFLIKQKTAKSWQIHLITVDGREISPDCLNCYH